MASKHTPKSRNAQLRKQIGEYKRFLGDDGSKDYLSDEDFRVLVKEANTHRDRFVALLVSTQYGCNKLHKYLTHKEVEDMETRNNLFASERTDVAQSIVDAKEACVAHNTYSLQALKKANRNNIDTMFDNLAEKVTYQNTCTFTTQTLRQLLDEVLIDTGSIISAEKKSFDSDTPTRLMWQRRLKERIVETNLTVPMAEYLERNLPALLEKRKTIIDRIIFRLQPLMRYMARSHFARGQEFWDLVQEANVALFIAIDRFDLTNDVVFITQLRYKIRTAMYDFYLENMSSLSMPKSITADLYKFKRKLAQLQTALKREPTIEELATAMKASHEKVKDMLHLNLSIVQEYRSKATEQAMQEQTYYIDESKQDLYVQVAEKELQTTLRAVLNTLTPLEEKLLRIQFGVDADADEEEAFSIEDLTRMYGITRERFRQIEGRAVDKLRHPSRSNILRRFLT